MLSLCNLNKELPIAAYQGYNTAKHVLQYNTYELSCLYQRDFQSVPSVVFILDQLSTNAYLVSTTTSQSSIQHDDDYKRRMLEKQSYRKTNLHERLESISRTDLQHKSICGELVPVISDCIINITFSQWNTQIASLGLTQPHIHGLTEKSDQALIIVNDATTRIGRIEVILRLVFMSDNWKPGLRLRKMSINVFKNC